MSADIVTFPKPRQADADDEAIVALLRKPAAILKKYRKGETVAEALERARWQVLRTYKDCKAGDRMGVALGIAFLFNDIEDAIEAAKLPAG